MKRVLIAAALACAAFTAINVRADGTTLEQLQKNFNPAEFDAKFDAEGFRPVGENGVELGRLLMSPKAVQCIQKAQKKAKFDTNGYTVQSVGVSKNGGNFRFVFAPVGPQDGEPAEHRQLIMEQEPGACAGFFCSTNYRCSMK